MQRHTDGKLMSVFIGTLSFIDQYLIQPTSENLQIMMLLIDVQVFLGFWRKIFVPHLVCFFYGIFHLRAVQKVCQIKFIIFCIFLLEKIALYLEIEISLEIWRKWFSMQTAQDQRQDTHILFYKKLKKSSVSCDPIFQMQKVIPASILNKLLHRHFYHWRFPQKAAFVTKRAFNKYRQT